MSAPRIDVIKVTVRPFCDGCDEALPDEECISGQRKFLNCRGCFRKSSVFYQAIVIEQMERVTQAPQQQQQKQELTTYRPRKVGTFKAGVPLPSEGACRHYSSSHRWFRFPCCGKAYACDECHWLAEKHEMERARNMVCGFCSQEQPIKTECQRCGKSVCYAGSGNAFWEGGKGVRNRTQMSNKDPHKFAGLGKTQSKRQQKKQ